MPTKHFGWMTLTPGQIEVSSGYNAFVNELDSLVYGILKGLRGLGGNFISGLQVSLVGSVLQVGSGWAILKDGTIFVNDEVVQVQGSGSGFVVVDGKSKTLMFKNSPDFNTDTLLAYVTSTTVYDLRFVTKDFVTIVCPTLTLKVVQGNMGQSGEISGAPEITVSQTNPFKGELSLVSDRDIVTFEVPFELRFGLPILPSNPNPLTIYMGAGTNAPPSVADVFVGLHWNGSAWSYMSAILGSTTQKLLPSGVTAVKMLVRGGRSEWQVKVNRQWELADPLTAPLGNYAAKFFVSVQSSQSSPLTLTLPPYIVATVR